MTVESNKRHSSDLSDTSTSKKPCGEKPCSKMDDAIAAMQEQHSLEFRSALERTCHIQVYNEKPCNKMDDAIAAMQEQHSLEFRNTLEKMRHVQAYNEKHEANER